MRYDITIHDNDTNRTTSFIAQTFSYNHISKMLRVEDKLYGCVTVKLEEGEHLTITPIFVDNDDELC